MFPEIDLALSAGYDSRSSYAALVAAGVPFRAYTCIKRDMTHADRTVPPKLCAEYGVSHRYRRPSTTPAEREARLAAFDAHTSGLCVDRDREYYGNHQHPDPEQTPAMIVGGGVWELAHNTPVGRMKSALAPGDDARAVFSGMKIQGPFMEALLNDYLEYVRAVPLPLGLALPDRFQLEQRFGCWLSGIEQGLDLLECTRLQPLNCAGALSLYMSLPRDELQSGAVQRELIRRNAPKLLRYPFNQKTPFERLRAKLPYRLRKLLSR